MIQGLFFCITDAANQANPCNKSVTWKGRCCREDIDWFASRILLK